MKEKIRAIFSADTHEDIKVELMEAFIMKTCQEYKRWANERDELIFSAGGLDLYCDDINLAATDVWERFTRDNENQNTNEK